MQQANLSMEIASERAIEFSRLFLGTLRLDDVVFTVWREDHVNLKKTGPGTGKQHGQTVHIGRQEIKRMVA